MFSRQNFAVSSHVVVGHQISLLNALLDPENIEIRSTGFYFDGPEPTIVSGTITLSKWRQHQVM